MFNPLTVLGIALIVAGQVAFASNYEGRDRLLAAERTRIRGGPAGAVKRAPPADRGAQRMHVEKRAEVEHVPLIGTLGGIRPAMKVTIGTPPQPLLVYFWMNGSDFLEVSKPCTTLDTRPGCSDNSSILFDNVDPNTLFQPEKSTTFTSVAVGLFDDFSAFNETVTMGGTTFNDLTIQIPNEDIYYVYAASVGVAGSLNIGARLDVPPTGPGPLYRMSATWPQQEFGLFISPVNNTGEDGFTSGPHPYDLDAGQITFGGLNPALYTGDINYLPTITEDNFYIALEGITVDSHEVDISGVQDAAATTTTSNYPLSTEDVFRRQVSSATSGLRMAVEVGGYIKCAPLLAERIHQHIPGAKSSTPPWASTMMYDVPCNTTAVITLRIGGVNYPMNPKDWTGFPGYGGMCVSLISGHKDRELWYNTGEPEWDIMVGSAFLQTVYTVFSLSPHRVGFAALSETAKAVRPVRVFENPVAPGFSYVFNSSIPSGVASPSASSNAAGAPSGPSPARSSDASGTGGASESSPAPLPSDTNNTAEASNQGGNGATVDGYLPTVLAAILVNVGIAAIM